MRFPTRATARCNPTETEVKATQIANTRAICGCVSEVRVSMIRTKGKPLEMHHLETQDDTENNLSGGQPLTMLDRCDSCGAQAFVRATLTSGELLFCAHHGAEAKARLESVAVSWHDESDKLLKR